MKDIILLGSTGSIGRNVLDVIRRYPDRFRVRGLATGENVSLLAEQAEEFHPDTVAVGKKELYAGLKARFSGKANILAGEEGLERLAAEKRADMIFMAISGTPALKPLVAALEAGKIVALASKEPVVSAGKILKDIQQRTSSRIIPVDSEHSAIMQCLSGRESADVRTLYITGSGGPLRDVKKEDFNTLSVDRILDHPKWNMGRKITVDSATLMNKGLEVIEARWLFDILSEKIKVVIHPEAIIHSMVEFVDGTISASMFCPDMRFPILRALAFPDIIENDFGRVDFSAVKNLTFADPDGGRFPALGLAFSALREGGTVPAVLNGSNEAAVKLFLDGKIRFTDIISTVEKVMGKHKKVGAPSLDDIIRAEQWAKEEVLREV
jgi:1-deoxy-D-xylulose-5-phosphate reductoisomerase